MEVFVPGEVSESKSAKDAGEQLEALEVQLRNHDAERDKIERNLDAEREKIERSISVHEQKDIKGRRP